MQMLGQLLRRQQVFLRVIKAAAMDRPKFSADALFPQLRIGRREQTVVQPDEIEGGAYLGDGDDDVQPAQQQIAPVEKVRQHSFHRHVPIFPPPRRRLQRVKCRAPSRLDRCGRKIRQNTSGAPVSRIAPGRQDQRHMVVLSSVGDTETQGHPVEKRRIGLG